MAITIAYKNFFCLNIAAKKICGEHAIEIRLRKRAKLLEVKPQNCSVVEMNLIFSKLNSMYTSSFLAE
jgi:hypothetical protein